MVKTRTRPGAQVKVEQAIKSFMALNAGSRLSPLSLLVQISHGILSLLIKAYMCERVCVCIRMLVWLCACVRQCEPLNVSGCFFPATPVE